MRVKQISAMIALIILLGGCNTTAENETVMLGDPPTPEQVIRGFYHTYLEYAANGELDVYFEDRVYQEYTYLDQEFIDYLESLRDQAGSWPYDPVLCSEDIPENLKTIGADIENEDIILNMASDLENHSFDIRLTPQEQHYVIREIICS